MEELRRLRDLNARQAVYYLVVEPDLRLAKRHARLAQRADGDGTITCEIVAPDGKPLSNNTSSGAFAVASCSANVTG